jgi:hypothetical protein
VTWPLQAYRDVGVRAFVCPLLGDLPFDATVAHGCGHGCSPYAGTDKHDPHKTDFIMAFMEQAVEVRTDHHHFPCLCVAYMFRPHDTTRHDTTRHDTTRHDTHRT